MNVKRNLFFYLLFCTIIWVLSLSAQAEVPAIQWEKTFGGINSDGGSSVQQTIDGGFIIAGVTASFGVGGDDVYLIKTDPNGNTQWEKTFGGSDQDVGWSVHQTTDGGFIITGSTSSYGAGNSDVYLIKTDSAGNLVWQKTFGGSDRDVGYSVQQTTDSGYIITGYTRSFGAEYKDVYLIKTDPNGNSQWQKTFSGSDGGEGVSVQQTDDGGYIIAGSTLWYPPEIDPQADIDVYLIKTEPNGNMQWQKTFGRIYYKDDGSYFYEDDWGLSVQQTFGGGFIITGGTTMWPEMYNVYLIKTNSSGHLWWEKTFGDSNSDWGVSVQQTSNGGFIIAGNTHSFGSGDCDLYLIKTNSSGNLQWQRTFGGSEGDYGYSVQQTIDDGFIIVGSIASASNWDVYLIKLGSEGDRDGDGLLDSWETEGIDIGNDGTIDLDLPALGANPNHKDLFVEIDAMAGRAPNESAIQRVVDAFAAVPNALVNNPDGNGGITLHCLPLDETNIPLADWPNAWEGFDAVKESRFGTQTQRDDLNWEKIKAAKALAYRYCIFADSHSGTTSSGLAELPGNDFMVTLGGWSPTGGTPDQQAGTFMHELGHTLVLRHGGVDNINHKPNYHSIMNYTWQIPMPGYSASWELDYSRQELPILNETNLDEPKGIGGLVEYLVPVGPPPAQLVNENGPVDWNRDKDTNDLAVSADITRLQDSQTASPNEILLGYNDWSNLWYQLSGHPNFQGGVHTETTIYTEMTFEVFQELSRIGCALADLNCDSHVDFTDVAILANQWLQPPGYPSADIAPENGDNIVNINDLKALCDNWLEGTTP